MVGEEASKRDLTVESMDKGRGAEYGLTLSKGNNRVYANILSTEMSSDIYQGITKTIYDFYNSNDGLNYLILVDTYFLLLDHNADNVDPIMTMTYLVTEYGGLKRLG